MVDAPASDQEDTSVDCVPNEQELAESLSFSAKLQIVQQTMSDFFPEDLPKAKPVAKASLLSSVRARSAPETVAAVIPLAPDLHSLLSGPRADLRKATVNKAGKSTTAPRFPHRPKAISRWYEAYSPDFPVEPPHLSDGLLKHTKTQKPPASVPLTWEHAFHMESAVHSSLHIQSFMHWFVATASRLIDTLATEVSGPSPPTEDVVLSQLHTVKELLDSSGRCLEDKLPFDVFQLWMLTLARRDAALKDMSFELPSQMRQDLRTAPLSGPQDALPSKDGGPEFLFRDQAALLAPEFKDSQQLKLTAAMLSSTRGGKSTAFTR